MNRWVAMAAAMVAATAVQGAVIKVNITQTGSGTATYVGETWNIASGATITDLADTSGASTGIALDWANGSGYSSGDRGENNSSAWSGTADDTQSTYDGNGVTYTADSSSTFFAWTPMDSYRADNAASGRDALMQIRLTSNTQLQYTFWVASSWDYTGGTNSSHPSSFNVGGAYNISNGSFTGGTTITLQAGYDQRPSDLLRYAVGKVGTFNSTWNGSAYEIVLQAGDGRNPPAATNGVVWNALVIEAIPEPATGSGLLFGAALLWRLRRRRSAKLPGVAR